MLIVPTRPYCPSTVIVLEWMKENGHSPATFMWEEYLNSPQEVPPDQLMTRIYWPIL